MTKVALANISLAMIGVRPGISPWEERSEKAENVRLVWDLTRQELLRAHPWNFAIKRKTLSALDDAPDFDWDVAYQLPTDYLRALELNGKAAGTGQAEFEIAGDTLLSNDDAAELKYVADVETVSEWDSSFQTAFAAALAAALAPMFRVEPGAGLQMRQHAENIAAQAFGPNRNETRPRAVLATEGSAYLRARGA